MHSSKTPTSNAKIPLNLNPIYKLYHQQHRPHHKIQENQKEEIPWTFSFMLLDL